MADPWVALAASRQPSIWWRPVRTDLIARIFVGVLLLFVGFKTVSRHGAVNRCRRPSAGAHLCFRLGLADGVELYARNDGSIGQWLIDTRNGTMTRQCQCPESVAFRIAGREGNIDWDTIRNFHQHARLGLCHRVRHLASRRCGGRICVIASQPAYLD
jgi:hypothetical protein